MARTRKPAWICGHPNTYYPPSDTHCEGCRAKSEEKGAHGCPTCIYSWQPKMDGEELNNLLRDNDESIPHPF